MKKLFPLILAAFLLTACEAMPEVVETPESGLDGETHLAEWTTLDAGVFTVTVPMGWTYNPEQGIDSTIGRIEGDGIFLEFDYGMYSGFLDTGTEEHYTIEETTIDGYSAQIATPKDDEGNLTIVFFESAQDGNRFNLYGQNLDAEQQMTAVQIFRSIQFKQ